MSLTQRVKQGFLRLPQLEKALLISSFFLMLSPLLPWYDNRNAFQVGDTFLGIQGPMFAIGFIILALGVFSFLKMVLPLLGQKFFMKRKNGGVALAVGIQSLLLVLVSNSIFFHPQFGENITHKATRFGMIVAFASIATLIIAGYFCYRKQKDMTPDEVMESMDAEPVEPIEPVISSYQEKPAEVVEPVKTEPVRQDYGIPARPNSPYSRPEGAYGGDPLQLDAKTRYKMMQSKARENLWQVRSDEQPNSSASGLARLDRTEQEVSGSTAPDGRKIRTDL